MKISPLRPLMFLVLLAMGTPLFAQDIAITATRKNLDQKRDRDSGNKTVTTKDIVYDVTLQNKAFKPATDIEVRYMIFYKDAKAGSTEKLTEISTKGSQKVEDIAPNRSISVQTEPLKLTTEQLDPNWYYGNGGKNKSEDRVTGIWFRVYSGGKMVSEYANPSTVAKRQPWQD